MDLDEFGSQFQNDGALRTQFASALAAKLGEKGITSRRCCGVSMGARANNRISTFVVGGSSNDALMQLRVANAAMEVLRDQGVTDLGRVNPLNPTDNDPAQWNVVYKDGGWVINGVQGADALAGGGLGGN